MDKNKAMTIIACVSETDYNDFVAPNTDAMGSLFCIERVDPEKGTQYLIERLNDTQSKVLITGWSTFQLPVDLHVFAPVVKYICHLCGEISHIISPELIKQGIQVTNWGDSIAQVVAEHCLLQAMCALRKITRFQLSMHTRQEWKDADTVPESLFGRTVGMHGFGSIAQQFARLIQPFDCQLSAFSPSVPDNVFAQYDVKRADSLEELYSQNQVIICLASLKPQTQGIVDEKMLRMIPEGGVFVNAGRGPVVNEADLALVAHEGKLQVALDVFTDEPLPAESPLRGCENVLLTPHIGGPTPGTRRYAGLRALENIEAFFTGKPMQGVIDAKRYKSLSGRKSDKSKVLSA